MKIIGLILLSGVVSLILTAMCDLKFQSDAQIATKYLSFWIFVSFFTVGMYLVIR